YLPGLVMAIAPVFDFIHRLEISRIPISHVNTIFISSESSQRLVTANIFLQFLSRFRKDLQIIAPRKAFDIPGSQAASIDSKTILTSNESEYILDHGNYLFTTIPLHHNGESYGFTL